MEQRNLGTSTVSVSAVTLGAWAIGGWMWGGQDEDEAIDAIHAAIDAGITAIDTAAVYGYGHSEEVVGKAIKGRRDKVKILTKYCLRWDDSEGEFQFSFADHTGREESIYRNAKPESIVYECEQSLSRLGIDCIDLYQCHWRDTSTPIEVTMAAVDKLIDQGKVRASGVSNFSVEELAACRAVTNLASDQPPYSMLRRDIEADVLPYCLANNIGVIVYSPLQRGLLTGKMTPETTFKPGDNRTDNPYFTPDSITKVNAFLDQIRPIADGHNATLAQIVIAWTIRQPGITAALVGARNRKQAIENAAAGELTLSDDETARINALLDDL